MSGLKVEIITLNGEPGRRVLDDWNCDGEIIPKGFKFDGASSPRVFWRVIPPFRNLEASCKHDFDCEKARQLMIDGKEPLARAARSVADKDYSAKISKCDGWLIGFIAWLGVRVGSMIGSGW